MSPENKRITEFDSSLIATYFKSLNRQGPGGDNETRKALGFLDLPSFARIADIGCGTGAQTSVLACSINGNILAVDILPEMIEGLNERMKKEGLDALVTGIEASMEDLPFEEGELDAIWAEGSIYNIGFEKGLTQWRRFLKTGGFIAVTEVSWLTDERPDDKGYLTDNHPEIANISEKVRILQNAGYEPIAHFVLPENCWQENYYQPMQAHMQQFLWHHGDSIYAQEFILHMKEEIAHYEKFKSYYGYVFYIGRRVD